MVGESLARSERTIIVLMEGVPMTHRYTNGKVAVEYLAEMMGVTLLDCECLLLRSVTANG